MRKALVVTTLIVAIFGWTEIQAARDFGENETEMTYGPPTPGTANFPSNFETKDTVIDGQKTRLMYFDGKWGKITESGPPLGRSLDPKTTQSTEHADSSASLQDETEPQSSRALEGRYSTPMEDLVSICHQSRTADLRAYATKALRGYNYGESFWSGGGGIGLGVNIKNRWRLGIDWAVRSSSRTRGSSAFPISLTYSRHIGKRWSGSVGGYVGPTASSNRNDKPIAGLTAKISFFVPHTMPNELPGAFGIFAESYFESEGRFGLRIGFAKIQSH